MEVYIKDLGIVKASNDKININVIYSIVKEADEEDRLEYSLEFKSGVVVSGSIRRIYTDVDDDPHAFISNFDKLLKYDIADDIVITYNDQVNQTVVDYMVSGTYSRLEREPNKDTIVTIRSMDNDSGQVTLHCAVHRRISGSTAFTDWVDFRIDCYDRRKYSQIITTLADKVGRGGKTIFNLDDKLTNEVVSALKAGKKLSIEEHNTGTVFFD